MSNPDPAPIVVSLTLESRPRRGVALMLVLATLLVVTVGAASIAALASTARQARSVERSTRVADDLLAALDAPLIVWLESVSSKVALAPDALIPGVLVLEESWQIDPVAPAGTASDSGPIAVAISVVAFDQCGMVHWRAARDGSVLRLALAEETLALVDGTPLPDDVLPGLDLAVTSTPDSVFPLASAVLDPGAARLGALIATHGGSVPRINVNTTPRPLLEHAMRAAGRGGLESIMASRAIGTPATAPPAPRSALRRDRRDERSANRRTDAVDVEIVASSDAWAFRIDIRTGEASRSWWAVYVFRSGEWRCAQRLAIPD